MLRPCQDRGTDGTGSRPKEARLQRRTQSVALKRKKDRGCCQSVPDHEKWEIIAHDGSLMRQRLRHDGGTFAQVYEGGGSDYRFATSCSKMSLLYVSGTKNKPITTVMSAIAIGYQTPNDGSPV